MWICTYNQPKKPTPAPSLHIPKKQSTLNNTFPYNTNLSADSNGDQCIQFPNKTNMSLNKNHRNNLISIDKPSSHLQNNIKLAKSNIPTPTPIIKQIITSTSRIYNTIFDYF